MRLIAIAALGLLACGHPASRQDMAGNCYAIVWSDATWARALPDTILLDSAADSSLAAALPGLQSIRERSRPPSGRLAQFQYVGWGETRDGTLLMLGGSWTKAWTARLMPTGDSLIGPVTGRTLNGKSADSSTFRAHAHRVTCSAAAGV